MVTEPPYTVKMRLSCHILFTYTYALGKDEFLLQFLQGLFVPRSQDQATSFRVEFVSESASNALGGPGQEYYLKETRDMDGDEACECE